MTNKASATSVCLRALLGAGLLSTLLAPRPALAQLSNALTGTAATSDDTIMGGFDIDLTLSDSSGLNAVGRNYRNEISAYFEPRFALGKRLFRESKVWSKLSLSARFVLTQALAGTSDEGFGSTANSGPLDPCYHPTPSQNGGIIPVKDVPRCYPDANSRRLDYSDVTVTAGLPRFARIPRANIDLSTSVRFTLPTSAQSQFATLRLALGGTLGLSRGFFKDKLRIGYNFGATKNFHAYSTPAISVGNGGPASDVAASSGLAGTGISNFYADPSRAGVSGFGTSYSFSNGLSGHLEMSEKWSADLLYLWTDGFSYGHRCGIEVPGLDSNTCTSGATVAAASGSTVDSRGHRRAQVFWATANYNYRPWLSFSLAWVNWAPREKPDTSYRQPFISTDYNAFTSVILSATTSLEEVAKRWRKTPPALAKR